MAILTMGWLTPPSIQSLIVSYTIHYILYNTYKNVSETVGLEYLKCYYLIGYRGLTVARELQSNW